MKTIYLATFIYLVRFIGPGINHGCLCPTVMTCRKRHFSTPKPLLKF